MLTFASQPSVEDIERGFPKQAAGGLAANLRCKMRADLGLSDCVVREIDPKVPGAQDYVRALGGAFRMERTQMERLKPVIVDVYLAIDDRRASSDGHRPCLAPLCTATIPPPTNPPKGEPRKQPS
jgi:hypothetical protein